MEQQPFESQLALVRSRGQWARQVSRPSADRLPEQFASFAQLFFIYVAQVFRPEAFDLGEHRFLRARSVPPENAVHVACAERKRGSMARYSTWFDGA